MRIWNVASGKLVAELEEKHAYIVFSVGITRTGDVVIYGGQDDVLLWRPDDRDLRRALAPVRALLEEEKRALQRVRDALSPGAAAAAVLSIIISGHTRRIATVGQSV